MPAASSVPDEVVRSSAEVSPVQDTVSDVYTIVFVAGREYVISPRDATTVQDTNGATNIEFSPSPVSTDGDITPDPHTKGSAVDFLDQGGKDSAIDTLKAVSVVGNETVVPQDNFADVPISTLQASPITEVVPPTTIQEGSTVGLTFPGLSAGDNVQDESVTLNEGTLGAHLVSDQERARKTSQRI